VTREDRLELLALIITDVYCEIFPLDRQEIRANVHEVLEVLQVGLLAASLHKITGGLNEVRNNYSVDI
jgi:hypothetical protein